MRAEFRYCDFHHWGLFIAFPSSFAQQTASDLFLEVSNRTVNPGGTVSARISTIMEPNATKDVMVRFLPPPGSEELFQSGKPHLQADSVGFADGTVWYPNALQNTKYVVKKNNRSCLSKLYFYHTTVKGYKCKIYPLSDNLLVYNPVMVI